MNLPGEWAAISPGNEGLLLGPHCKTHEILLLTQAVERIIESGEHHPRSDSRVSLRSKSSQDHAFFTKDGFT